MKLGKIVIAAIIGGIVGHVIEEPVKGIIRRVKGGMGPSPESKSAPTSGPNESK